MIRTTLVAVLCFAAPLAARAEDLIVALSSEKVEITPRFVGEALTLFGSIERNAGTVARGDVDDIVVVVRGPRGSVTVREKKQLGPLWLNLDQRRYVAVPSYIAVLASRPLDQIASPGMREKLRLGIPQLVPPQSGSQGPVGADEPLFREALVRLRREQRLYRLNEAAVQFLSPALFRVAIRVPGIAPLGRYDADVILLNGGVQLARKSIQFEISKEGAEQSIARVARDYAPYYGAVVALMAAVIGWLATVVFRRD